MTSGKKRLGCAGGDPGEMRLVTFGGGEPVAPRALKKPPQPACRMHHADFATLVQEAEEPPLEGRRSEQGAIQVEERGDGRRERKIPLRDHPVPPAAPLRAAGTRDGVEGARERASR